MATQSLYRRFRPRKFSELYGQEHVVRALRNAVINSREGQAYLFSGPRGTGKTTTARILAKVLNCSNPVDGEPCCECDSCKAVELGTSYDVLELDAASNNGVQQIRDIIESAALTSPGRHRVFILDEVHMLTPGAEAALLKTLEEPPPHVVFVLATTDPQKVSATIRSRVQHLQFHLLPVAELEKYVRFVVQSAGLNVDDAEIEMVLRQGGGSARDTLSALELVVAGGGDADESSHTEEIVRAIIARDHGAALAAVARAMQQGRDAHNYAEDVVRTMRDYFLSLMSPDLVQLPAARVDEMSAIARDLGVQRIVRIMETLGTTMVEMRHAPDPRLLLEVAVVQLASPAFDDSNENLLARISQLEDAVRQLKENGVAAAIPPAPLNATTGRARVGGLATAAATGPIPTPTAKNTASDAPANQAPAPEPTSDASPSGSPAAAQQSDAATHGGDPAQLWPQIQDAMRGLSKALFKTAVVESFNGKLLVIKLPTNTPTKRAQDQMTALNEAMTKVCGRTYQVTFIQADPTGGIVRPAIIEEEVVVSIVEQVAKDPFAAIDLSETVPAMDTEDPIIAALKDKWPEGMVIEETASSEDTTPAKPRRKK